MNRPPRVNYDQIATLYDSQPYRARDVDPAFLAFLRERGTGETLAALDIACGTGNQLISNRTVAPSACLVGVDRSLGMLRRAQAKNRDIGWVHADAATLPFAARSFDFVSCQFASHHFHGKADMLRETYRVLRPGGRFVLRNLCPQQSGDWLYYRYFPQAQVIDLTDFWPLDAIEAVMGDAGFTPVRIELEHLRFDVDLAEWLKTVRRRDTCSQLQVIDDGAYQAGVAQLEHEVAAAKTGLVHADHLCMVHISGDKAGD